MNIQDLSGLLQVETFQGKPKRKNVKETKCDGYTRIDMQVDGGSYYIPLTVLAPTKPLQHHPAIQGCHSHGGKFDVGRLEIIDPASSSDSLATGVTFAQQGWFVVAIDYNGFGDLMFATSVLDRNPGELKFNEMLRTESLTSPLGAGYLLRAIFDSSLAFTVLDEYANPTCKTIYGFSMGGHIASKSAAFLDVKMMFAHASTGLMSHKVYAANHFGVGVRTKSVKPDPTDPLGMLWHDDVVPFYINCPDHSYFSIPQNDPYCSGGDVIAQALESEWERRGCREKLQITTPECGHTFPQNIRQEMYDWFNNTSRIWD